MKNLRKTLCIMLCLALCFSTTAFAHSGRTDASGGHRDNKNASGLGYYHYHCGGYPAHLHDGGFCPYASGGSQSSSSSTPKPAKKKKAPKISKRSAVLATGKTLKLKVKNTYGKKVKWKSKNRRIAVVSKTGKVTAKRAGRTKITGKVNGKTVSCTIRVVNPRLNYTSKTVYEGDDFQLRVKGTSSSVYWDSTNYSNAFVDDDGYVECYEAGSVYITAKVNGKRLKCRVRILEQPEEDL